MSKLLITGIEGFVGQHLAARLSQNHEVYGLHRADAHPGIHAILRRGDVCDFASTEALLQSVKPDGIFHLAGIAAVGDAVRAPLVAYEVNALGTVTLLEAVRSAELEECRVVLISSGDVYGASNTGTPLGENADLKPVTPYGLSKLALEQTGLFYHRKHKMDVVIVRPFSHTGPGQREPYIFARIAQELALIERKKREAVIKVGDIDVSRDYTDVRDIVEAYAVAFEKCSAGDPYNITRNPPQLLRTGVEYLIKLSGLKVELKDKSPEYYRGDEPTISTGDASKFVAATGWRPEIPFERTLQDLLEFHRALR
jgi:GDP-4-dehydro-6-deoxy-D-mannose reductase